MNAGRENTIHSLNTAAKRGADYVEFDVQLSKDKVCFCLFSEDIMIFKFRNLRDSLEVRSVQRS